MDIHGTIKQGEIIISTRSREFLKNHEGKDVIISLDDRESTEKRRFFEGCVTQYFYYQHPYSGWTDFRQAREVLKVEFNGEWINDKDGKQIRIPKSTKLSNTRFTEFIEKIQDYFIQNGLEWPDSEDFLKWQGSAPSSDEIYPPLFALRNKYQTEKDNPKPVWRR